MKKQLPTGAVIAIVVVVVALAAFIFVKGTSGSRGVWNDEQEEIADALERVGNDTTKLDPAMRKRLEDELAKHPMSSGPRGGGSGGPVGSGPVGGPVGSAPGGTGGNTPIPQAYGNTGQ